tara:strand:+ start:605 stop:1276 length:672 start_codon:yes stop_codon:yes gene_type:complete
MDKRKKVIIYTINDPIFTLPIVNYICKYIVKNNNIEILVSKKKQLSKIKVLICFLFFGSITDLFKLLKKKIILKNILNKQIKLITKPKKKYRFGISINYSKKIKLGNFNVFNFHLGNFDFQRGVFIFFYKFCYDWKYIDLTFHKIDKYFDKGTLLKKKKIKISNKNSVKICSIYHSNFNFVKDCILLVQNKKFFPNKPQIKGKYNFEPSFAFIFKIIINKILL